MHLNGHTSKLRLETKLLQVPNVCRSRASGSEVQRRRNVATQRYLAMVFWVQDGRFQLGVFK